jgi:hypothetical protein
MNRNILVAKGLYKESGAAFRIIEFEDVEENKNPDIKNIIKYFKKFKKPMPPTKINEKKL